MLMATGITPFVPWCTKFQDRRHLPYFTFKNVFLLAYKSGKDTSRYFNKTSCWLLVSSKTSLTFTPGYKHNQRSCLDSSKTVLTEYKCTIKVFKRH